MKQEMVTIADAEHRDDDRLVASNGRYVSNQARIGDLIDHRSVITTPASLPADTDIFRNFFAHSPRLEPLTSCVSEFFWHSELGAVFDREFFMILNLAVGGTLGGFIAPDLEFPVHLHADYLRVYQQTNVE